jgi:hypothetical protein
MSSPKVLMGVHIARYLVYRFLGGNPPFHIVRSTLWTDISRPSCSNKIFLSQPLIRPTILELGSVKQQLVGRYVAPFGQIIPIPSQPVWPSYYYDDFEE